MNDIENITEIKIDNNTKNHILNYIITIYRNFDNIPFVNRLSAEQKNTLDSELLLFSEKRKRNFSTLKFSEISESYKQHLIRKGLLDNTIEDNKIKLSYNENTLITYNHINHLTITGNGTSFPRIFNRLKDIESKFSEFSPYMVNTRYGYMSPQILNCGLSMKLSVLLHLAGISKSGKYEAIKELAFERGYVIEEWSSNSDFYIVSSRLNYGLTEKQLIERFLSGINDIITMEKDIISNFYYDNQDIDDEIYRSIGMLKYARKMSINEMTSHLSNIRIGIKLNKKLPFNIKQINYIQSKLSEDIFSEGNDLTGRANTLRGLMEDFNV